MRYFALLIMLLLPLATAQFASGPDPETVADEAVEAWLASPRPDMLNLSARTAEELCEMLPALVTNPPPPLGTNVNLTDRRAVELEDDSALIRRFTYPAELPDGRLEVVEVLLEESEGVWQATQVGYRVSVPAGGGRPWLQTSTASGVFIAFTLLVIYLLSQSTSFLRRWLNLAREAILEHRRLVIGTLIALYAIFGLGMLTGTTLPPACEVAVASVINFAVTNLGATDAYGSLNIPRAAVVTFYQNFVVVTFSVIFGAALLFGVPAYLFAALSFYVQGIPFGLLMDATPLQLLFLLILLILELTSYFLVVAGGGMLLMTLIRKGFRAFPEALRKAALMLPIAMLLLLVGAWYEAGIIILPQLLP